MGINIKFSVKKRPMSARQRHTLIVRGITEAFKDIGKQSINLRKNVIRTWQGAKPDWESRVYTTLSGQRVILHVIMKGDPLGKKKWYWLDRGTRIRYATMTPGFEAKTTYRTLGSRRGRGGLAYIDVRRPKPGIEAREFDDEANLRMNQRVGGKIEDAVDKAFRRERFTGSLI